MSEEEIKIIKHLKIVAQERTIIPLDDEIKIMLDLIENQEKEILTLKEKNKTLESLLQGNLYEMYKYYRELGARYQANCVSKDDIKLKIKELEQAYEDSKNEDGESEYYFPNYTIEVLEKLLEETENG